MVDANTGLNVAYFLESIEELVSRLTFTLFAESFERFSKFLSIFWRSEGQALGWKCTRISALALPRCWEAVSASPSGLRCTTL